MVALSLKKKRPEGPWRAVAALAAAPGESEGGGVVGGVLGGNEGRAKLFFFPAEDGIRGIGVTGVQTCALPISRAPASSRASTPDARSAASSSASRASGRPEERRVGKECRSRWSPYH